jgi:hypothetical protein
MENNVEDFIAKLQTKYLTAPQLGLKNCKSLSNVIHGHRRTLNIYIFISKAPLILVAPT